MVCVAAAAFALMLHAVPGPLHTEYVSSPSCFVDPVECEIAAKAARDAFAAVGSAESTAWCEKRGPTAVYPPAHK